MANECSFFLLSLKFYKLDKEFYYQSPLRVREGQTWNGLLVYVLIGSNIINWNNPQYTLPNVDNVEWLRPVHAYGGIVYCTDEVAYASYGYDNIFFYYTPGFNFPSRSPIGRPNYLDYDSRNMP